MKTIRNFKEENISPRLNQVEEILSKYEAKDYFDTNAMADSFVKQWEDFRLS